ncbi:MmoB/DmpM family protein [Pseudomonas extremaustralis]|jgi:phenol hydroxylase P2 protein|uniref:Monooxygenase n=1 Tax=Pseudomonas extremaustralis TaxID=359110 RepID=A0A5C5Q5E7_9PSED|nr:MmoB/DmpM family protein [Pseudomonas extremaustralis]EZI24929.1 monooxygenase [Pseudomonas extremaustralis 14-3 substr. 14-3b]MDB1112618.1 MmoB/DmpM family protein [Pseudomonas extremaustralis]MDF3134241.1 MmoB/DmpM family protein [Pseudomonas extremaustralis]MDG2970757.1 MmoB/DmpM family protein [Pseudomonas extremaustralis]MDY7065797.1 Phenol hydroxylase P2 protein [Pseudomonas extremaustralis]
MSTVFIALQTNEETRPIIEAIELDNPEAVVNREPAMVKINAPGRLVIRRESIEAQLGRSFDMQELNVNLITLSGNVDEDEDALTLTWGN